LDIADTCFKQSVKIFNELKNTDMKLREGFIYSNEYLENLSKVAISNNMLISKLRKIEVGKNLVSLNYNFKKYKCNVPILEINEIK
jgi:hypothetical protein